MADVQQIYGIVNSVGEQALGEKAVTVTDTASFVALGNQILNSSTNVDKWTGALIDLVGRTVFSIRPYLRNNKDGMRIEPFEFGCILQKIRVDLPDASQNNAWEIAATGYKPEYAPVIKTTVNQKLFDKISTWEIDVTIPDTILKTAFRNEQSMATFIDAVFVAVDTRMELALEGTADLTRANFIAHKMIGSTGINAINLLKGFNDLFNPTTALTAAEALTNKDFLRYAANEIGKWKVRLSRLSTLFNLEEYPRHTPEEYLVFVALQDFESAETVYLESDTYNKQLVALPHYTTVPYWQGSGTDYSFAETSKISVSVPGATPQEANVEATYTGVLGIMYDIEAMGITINERRTTSERNNKDEYTNYYNKANIGFFNDMSENGIVFYIADAEEPVTPPAPTAKTTSK